MLTFKNNPTETPIAALIAKSQMFLSTAQRGKEQRALRTGRKDETKAQMRWERALPHIPASLQNPSHINIEKFAICKFRRSQQAVPGKGITLNNQQVFQAKLMLLAATLAGARHSTEHRWGSSGSRDLGDFWGQWDRDTALLSLAGAGPLCWLQGGAGEVSWALPTPACTPAFPLTAGKPQLCSMHRLLVEVLTNRFPVQEGALGFCLSLLTVSASFPFLTRVGRQKAFGQDERELAQKQRNDSPQFHGCWSLISVWLTSRKKMKEMCYLCLLLLSRKTLKGWTSLRLGTWRRETWEAEKSWPQADSSLSPLWFTATHPPDLRTTPSRKRK